MKPNIQPEPVANSGFDPDYFQKMVKHIARLSQKPGWGAFARHWAQDLETHSACAYKNLVSAVRMHLHSEEGDLKK